MTAINNGKPAQPAECTLSRRDFIRITAVVSGATAFLGSTAFAVPEALVVSMENGTSHGQIENHIFSICQQCNGQCGIKVKLQEGIVTKIGGNPYSPWNLHPHKLYSTPIGEMAAVEGALCPRGQAGIQSVYDPYRLVKVLKRAGKRGENKWETVPFGQAVDEIVNGGKLFAHVSGEENRDIEGLKDLWVMRDPATMKAMGEDIKKILGEKDLAAKKALVEKFKVDHAAHLDAMIDPDHPDLGTKNNQILYFWGRQKAGRGEFIKRFFNSGLGTVNTIGHTTVCQGSLYFAGKAMTEQWDNATAKWTGGAKNYWHGDPTSARFGIFVGSNVFEGNYALTNKASRIVTAMAQGGLKYAVIDPRHQKAASKAWKWLPNIPGSDAAIALALIRWIIENERYDAKYLTNANKGAAIADKEPTWTNAVWLVKVADGKAGKFLHGSDLGLVEKVEEEVDGNKVVTYVSVEDTAVIFATDPFVTLNANGEPVLFDPNDETTTPEGQLLVDTTVGDFEVKSGMQILWESASKHTVEEWAAIAGVRASDLEAIAREFTSYGKNVFVDIHRGVSQHTNGFYNVTAWFTLPLLVGNYDWKGGQSWSSTYDILGAKAKGPFDLAGMDPGKLSGFGIDLVRTAAKYEDSTLFMDLPEDQRYPAKRNWYPLATDVYQEILPSAADGYPYPIKVAFMYMASPVYSNPAGHTWIPILRDTGKVPLLIASDIVIGETSMYADYIFPDTSYLERWEFSGSHSSITFKVQGVRQPVIAPLTGSVKVFGQEMAQDWEALLLALAEKLELPNFGPDGLGDGLDFTHQDDLYMRLVTNLAFGEKEDGSDMAPEADEEEIRIFMAARQHLPKWTFDAERWQQIAGEHWPKVVYVLNRGGRFEDYDKGYPGDKPSGTLGRKYGKQINMYQEKTAGVKYSGTGKSMVGYATYIEPRMSFTGTVLDDSAEGYDLTLITYREVTQTKSRTAGNPWLTSILPENFVLMNAADAAARGLADGDVVRVSSATNPEGIWQLNDALQKPMDGKIKVTQGMRPGVIGFSLGFGHWAYGSHKTVIDGTSIAPDERRGRGIHANAAMRTDPHFENTSLVDPVGGSVVFYGTQVKLEKV